MLPSSGCLGNCFREHCLDVIKKKVAMINIQRLLCTVIKFHVVKEAKEAVLFFLQDFKVDFDRGWQSYGRILVKFTVFWQLNVLIYL